jgi:hypothetical protein
VLSGTLWELIGKPPKTYDFIPSLPIPRDEISKIEVKDDFDGKGNYNYEVYNGSKWTIEIIRLSIGANDGHGKPILKKIYETTVKVLPFSTEHCLVKLSNYDYAPPTFGGGRWVLDPIGPFEELDRIGRPEGSKSEVRVEELLGYKAQ